MKKINYFYVDETGHVNNDSPLFFFGCIKTDTPNLIESTLNELKKELAEDALLSEFGKRIIDNNFHATGDPFDIRTAVFRILPYLNFRAYFTGFIKNNEFYDNLKSNKKDYEIIESLLRKLIVPRINKNKNDVNKFYFETLEVEGKSLKRILEDIFSSFPSDFEIEYYIVEKENPNIPIIDYVNFILNKSLQANKLKNVPEWAVRAFEVVKDKIALIHIQNTDSFFSRFGDVNHKIELQNLINKTAGD